MIFKSNYVQSKPELFYKYPAMRTQQSRLEALQSDGPAAFLAPTASRPLFTAENKFFGVVGADLSLEGIMAYLCSPQMRLTKGMRHTVLELSGQIIASERGAAQPYPHLIFPFKKMALKGGLWLKKRGGS